MCPYTCNLSSGFTCGLKFWKKRLKLEHGVEESEVLQQQQQRRQQQQQQQLSPPKQQNINNNYYLYHSNNNQRIHNSQRVRTNLFEFEKDVLCENMLQHSKTNTPPFQRESCCFLSVGHLYMPSWNQKLSSCRVHLEKDSFIHLGTRNLVILDDLMYTTAIDFKINELLTIITDICQSWPSIKICTVTKTDPETKLAFLVLFNSPV